MDSFGGIYLVLCAGVGLALLSAVCEIIGKKHESSARQISGKSLGKQKFNCIPSPTLSDYTKEKLYHQSVYHDQIKDDSESQPTPSQQRYKFCPTETNQI